MSEKQAGAGRVSIVISRRFSYNEYHRRTAALPSVRRMGVCIMSRIDETVKRESVYIAAFVGVLSVLMQAVFLVAGRWDYTVLCGNLLSAAAAVGNFFLMGLTVQKALGKGEKEAADTMRLSQRLRLLLLFVVVAVGAAAPCFHTLAVIIPLFFPRVAIAVRPLMDKRNKNGDGKEGEGK